jgi:hypothetical protein
MLKPVVALMENSPSFPLTLDQLRMLNEDNVCEIDRYVKAFQIEPKSLAQILPTLLGEPPAARR